MAASRKSAKKSAPKAPGRKPRSVREGEVRRPGDGARATSDPRAGKQPDPGSWVASAGAGRKRPAGSPRRRGAKVGGPGQTGRAAHGPQDEGAVLKSGPAQADRKLTRSGREHGEDQGQGGWEGQAGRRTGRRRGS
jgi:hypothetical protein